MAANKKMGLTIFFSGNGDKNVLSFDDMMKKMLDEHGRGYIENGLYYSMNNMGNTNNLIDNFIKYLVITNYEKLHCELNKDCQVYKEGELEQYECLLCDFPLAHVYLEFPENESRYLYPDNLKVRNNLTGTKLGQVMLQYLMKTVNTKYPGKSLVSNTVQQSNISAIKLYERMGGIFFVNGMRVDNPVENIDHSTKKYCSVIFPNDRFEEICSRTIEPPVLEGLTNIEVQTGDIGSVTTWQEIGEGTLQCFCDNTPNAISSFDKLEQRVNDQKKNKENPQSLGEN